MKNETWDVVIVGAGPAGSAAAKRCAGHGLKTLLLEKRQPPRHKVCTGALMGATAQRLVDEVFGKLPPEVLTDPPYVEGFIVYSPGYEGRKSPHRMPLTWRQDLDYWMNGLAVKAGAELRVKARVNGVIEEADGCRIILQGEEQPGEIKAKYVIGADGANSVIRRAIFPDFRPRFLQAFQEVYKTRLNLDPNYIHWYVLFPERNIFEVHQKTWQGTPVTVLDANGRPGQVAKREEVVPRALQVMAQECGFDPASPHLWTDGCRDAMWLRELFTGVFAPVKGRVLLCGDAGGVRLPVTAEGIGTGIQTGLLAADAVRRAVSGEGSAEGAYRAAVQGLLAELRKLMPPSGYLAQQGDRGVEYLLDAYRQIYDIALKY
ncbi:MAG: NAD(P)/FAD-dependent oxidoreductase [Chloroflexota bacterium]